MFEKFNAEARQVVVNAQDEAKRLSHIHIGAEHLLLSLLDQAEGLPASVLGSFGLVAEDVREQVRAMVPRSSEPLPMFVPLTAAAKAVLEQALREAFALDDNYVGPHHLLLALARERDGIAATVLTSFAADHETIRSETIRRLESSKPPEPAQYRTTPLTGVAEHWASEIEDAKGEGWELLGVFARWRKQPPA
jgi:ATP-dependent Clp protease ATP-binding subunit ClpC